MAAPWILLGVFDHMSKVVEVRQQAFDFLQEVGKMDQFINSRCVVQRGPLPLPLTFVE